MDLQQKLGLVLRELRTAKNLSQEALAHEAGVDRTYIGDIEKGERNVSLKIVEQICKALDISLSELFKKIENYGSTE